MEIQTPENAESISFRIDLASLADLTPASKNATVLCTQQRLIDCWIVGTLFALAIVINLFAPWWFETQRRINDRWWYEMRATASIGLKLSEFVILGVAIGFGHWNPALRILFVGVASLVLAASFVIGCQAIKMPFEIGVFCFLMSIGITYFLGFALWILAYITKLRISRSNYQVVNHNSTSSQFNIRLLFSVMIAVAISIPCVRMALPTTSTGGKTFEWFADATFWAIWLTCGISMLATTQMLVFLSRRMWMAWFGLVLLIVYGPYLFQQVGAFVTLGGRFRFKPSFDNYCMAYFTMLGFLTGNTVFFLLLRIRGFQLRNDIRPQTFLQCPVAISSSRAQ
jgi:hypothetical protein